MNNEEVQVNEEVHEVSEPMPPEADITQNDLQSRPTIFVTQTEWGGIEFGSNSPSLPLVDAIVMLEVAKHELVRRQIAAQDQERERRRPQIFVPR